MNIRKSKERFKLKQFSQYIKLFSVNINDGYGSMDLAESQLEQYSVETLL
jgi:hypothetical protein